jgi:hypothetical protein
LALQWMDDFTIYGTDTNRANRLLDGPYAFVGRFDLQADPDPTAGGKQVLHGFAGGLGGEVRKILTAQLTTVGSAARYWLTHLPGNDTVGECPSFAAFKDINNKQHLRVSPNPSGYVEIWRTDGTGEVMIGQSASPVIVTNAWRHIEVKAVFDASAGSVDVRLEGTTVLSISGIRTTSNVAGAVASCNIFAFQSPQDGGIAPDMYVKDFILWDATGTANNSFFGSCQVYKIMPDADVSLNWTPSSGTTGFNLINGTTPDDDTGYISAPVPAPSPAEFTLSDLPVNVTSVRGVMTIHRSRKTDGGDGQLQVSVISGANTGNGADRTITTAYTYWWDTFDKDPGGGAWTKALVNALHLKINRTV